MALEANIESAGYYIDTLNDANPTSSDPKSEGDNHIRGIKNLLTNTFSAVTGEVTATHTELNILDGVTATTAEINQIDGIVLDQSVDTTASPSFVAGTLTAGNLSLANTYGVVIKDAAGTYRNGIALLGTNDLKLGDAGADNITFNNDFGVAVQIDETTGKLNAKADADVVGTLSFGSLTDGAVTITDIIDSDTMTGATAAKLSTSESIKAYVDAQIAAIGGGVLSITSDYVSSNSLTSGTGEEAKFLNVTVSALTDYTKAVVEFQGAGASTEGSASSYGSGNIVRGKMTSATNLRLCTAVSTDTWIVGRYYITEYE